jgi:hypothetical protein
MITTLISVLVLLVIAYVVYLVLEWILSLVALPGPATKIIWLIFGIIVVVELLSLLGIYKIALK